MSYCALSVLTLSLFTAACTGHSLPTSATVPPAIMADIVAAVTVTQLAPSGDISGVTDADNIETALNVAKANGDVVHLTDGDATTVDHYYTSRNIVVENFSGTLKGEGMDNTIIHAGRRSAAIGFQPAISPWWSSHGSAVDELATVLQFDDASGSVTITDLTVEAKDDQPTDLIPDYYGDDVTYITTLIEILGGEHDTRIENVRLEGKETTAEGNRRGLNVDMAIHVMLDVEGGFGTGDLRVKNLEIANTNEGVMFMRYQDGSTINIDGVRASNVRFGIWGANVLDSSVQISNSDVAIHPAVGFVGINLVRIPSGLEVVGNTVTGSAGLAAVYMRSISNATVVGNTIKDVELRNLSRASIYLWNSHDNRISGNTFEAVSGGVAGIRLRAGSSGNTLGHNDFVKSGLPGWTATTPSGPGAILLDPSTLSNNVVGQAKFPGFPDPTAICSQVLDLGNDNRIAGMDRCEHMPP